MTRKELRRIIREQVEEGFGAALAKKADSMDAPGAASKFEMWTKYLKEIVDIVEERKEYGIEKITFNSRDEHVEINDDLDIQEAVHTMVQANVKAPVVLIEIEEGSELDEYIRDHRDEYRRLIYCEDGQQIVMHIRFDDKNEFQIESSIDELKDFFK